MFGESPEETRRLSENALSESRTSLTCPNSSELSKNNARNIKHMAVLIFRKFFDLEQVSADSEMPILGQPPSRGFRMKML